MTGNATLHPCWFCGYKKVRIYAKKRVAELDTSMQEDCTAGVRCARCHARGPTTRFLRPFSRETYSAVPEEAETEAARLWNAVGERLGQAAMKGA